MQSDVPPLPISCLTNKLRLNRIISNTHQTLRAQSIKKTSPLSKIYKNTTALLPDKKKLNLPAATSSPYKNSARLNVSETAKTERSDINQRVSSAKMLRIKELQNQLADAHFHLNELSNENKLLKAIQRRQDTALKRYEGKNAELPRIINTHHEDLRVLQTKYKKLKSDYNATSDKLKEKESELHILQVQNRKLLQLSKDRHLGERDKLQTQVFDLTHRINEQDETIQTLKRKLTLETKYLKHQLHVEMVKHKETLKQLQETQYKLKNLEELYEQKERQSYHASRIMASSRARSTITSQSLINLSDGKSDYSARGPSSFRKSRNESSIGQSLPALNGAAFAPISTPHFPEPFDRSTDNNTPSAVNEIPFDSRLHNSPVLLPKDAFSSSKYNQTELLEQRDVEKDLKSNSRASRVSYELPKNNLKKDLDYSSDDSHCKDEEEQSEEIKRNDRFSFASSRSRLLHARLVNSASEGVRPDKAKVSSRSRSLTKENLENIAENDSEMKYDRDSVVTVISREVTKETSNNNSTSSDVESEMDIPMDLFSTEEDEEIVRKSDEIKVEKPAIDTSATLFHKPSTFLFGAEETKKYKQQDVEKKAEFKSINGLTTTVVDKIISTEKVNGTIIDEIVAKKKVVSNKIIKTSRDADSLLRNAAITENHDSYYSSDSISSKTNDSIDEIIDDEAKLTNKEKTKIVGNGLTKIKSINSDDTSHRTEKSDAQITAENENAIKSFDKAKLLAAMKAIDDNENIEFVEQKSRKNSASNRLRITENLYRGVPTHSRKKNEIMKELFADTGSDNNKNS